MSDGLRPGAALDPETVSECYLGGRAREPAHRRLETCYVLLLGGRLGLRPGELQHLHAGWIDWDRGHLRVPGRDPCACDHCWEHARVAQRAGDGRGLGAIVAADCWGPPGGDGRIVPFGWSRRLTAVLAAGLDIWTFLDRSVPEIRATLREAARAAGVADPEAVTPLALRASAGRFFADAGLDPAQLAAVLDVDRETATEFSGGQVADPGTYPLLTDPASLDREPFDPTDYDADWRARRAAARAGRPTRSPRPTAVPADVDYDPPDDAGPIYPDPEAETDANAVSEVSAALAEWLAGGTPASDRSATRPDGAAAEPVAVPDDPREQVTAPVRFEVATRFACSQVRGGRPAGGNVLLAQDELVMVTHGDGENVAHEVVPLHAIADVAIGYCPDALESVFDETLGVAYRDGDERRVAVIELPDDRQRALATALFARRLDGANVVVTHPARLGDRVTDASPARGALSVEDDRLAVAVDADSEPLVRLRLGDVVHAERTTQVVGGDPYRGLRVRHVRPTGRAVSTALSPVDEDERTLFCRFVLRDYRRRRERVAGIDLGPAHREALLALYAAEDSVDVATMLEMDRERLRGVLADLEAARLVRSADGGTWLTGAGLLLVDDAVDDLDV